MRLNSWNCRGNTSHGRTLLVTPHPLLAFPESLPAPLRAQGSAMASVTPSPGPSTLSAPALEACCVRVGTGGYFHRLAQHEQPEPDVAYQAQDQKHRSDVPPEYQTQN